MAWVRGGTPLIDGGSSEGTMLLMVDGAPLWCPGYFRKGEPFYVYGVNDLDGRPYPLIPSMDVDSDGFGRVQIWLAEKLWATGPNQNVSALPINNAAILSADTATPTAPGEMLFPVRQLDHPDFANGLASCPKCGALVLRGNVQLHAEWHHTLKTSVTVSSFGLGGIGL